MDPLLPDLRVLDLTRLLPGQYATSLLADMGAEIVMVERPPEGNPSRRREPTVDGRGAAHLLRDRGKRSVAIDLKRDRGREAFLALAETADVVLESLRPGAVDRLGVAYDDVRAAADPVVYCSLTGYGQTGPDADRPGHDLNYAGVGGLLALTGGPDEPPTIPGYPVADLAGALYATTAITAAHATAVATGESRHLDVSMTDAVASFSAAYADRMAAGEDPPARGETALTGRHPGYGVFEAADGEFLTVAALEERFWRNLCDALERPDLRDDHVAMGEDVPDDRRRALAAAFRDRIAERPREEWLARFDEYDVPAGPVNEFADVFTDPQLRARGAFGAAAAGGDAGAEDDAAADAGAGDGDDGSGDDGAPDGVGAYAFTHRFGRDGPAERSPAPRCGEDTDALLAAAGYDRETLDRLAADGVVARPDGA